MTKPAAKEEISGSYTADWHEKTKNWTLPTDRRVLVIGSNNVSSREEPSNIGNAIARRLERGKMWVAERDIDLFDAADKNNYHEHSGIGIYDTLVLANGETNLAWIEDQPLDKIQDVIENKLLASIFAVSHFAKVTLDRPCIKNIVLVGSMAHRSILNASAPYCAACAGLVHFGKCAAWELGPKGYRVFIVNPSNVYDTPMTEKTIEGIMDYRNLDYEEAEAYWSAVRCLPHWLRKDNIAAVAHWLITSPSAEWLSGVPLDLGGGLR